MTQHPLIRSSCDVAEMLAVCNEANFGEFGGSSTTPVHQERAGPKVEIVPYNIAEGTAA